MILCLRDDSCLEYLKTKQNNNLSGLGKQMHWKRGKRLASHITRKAVYLPHKHEKYLTSFVIWEMQNRITVYKILLEEWKWQKKVPNIEEDV